MALESIYTHKFRSFLTILGIVVGVITAIVVASILTGMRNSIVSIVEEYGTNNIYAYHLSTGETYGAETARTFYQGDRSFFIDHAFLPRALAPFLRKYEIGSIGEWRPVSDHLPLTMDIAIAELGTT